MLPRLKIFWLVYVRKAFKESGEIPDFIGWNRWALKVSQFVFFKKLFHRLQVSLLCEACFQTGAIYLAKQIEKDGKSLKDVTPVLSRITDARFKQMVKPGDEITIEVTMTETVSRFFFMKGKVIKDGKPAMTINFALAMVDEGAAK